MLGQLFGRGPCNLSVGVVHASWLMTAFDCKAAIQLLTCTLTARLACSAVAASCGSIQELNSQQQIEIGVACLMHLQSLWAAMAVTRRDGLKPLHNIYGQANWLPQACNCKVVLGAPHVTQRKRERNITSLPGT